MMTAGVAGATVSRASHTSVFLNKEYHNIVQMSGNDEIGYKVKYVLLDLMTGNEETIELYPNEEADQIEEMKGRFEMIRSMQKLERLERMHNIIVEMTRGRK